MPLTDTTKIIEHGIVATGDRHNRVGHFAILIRNDRIIDIVPHAEPLKHQFPNAEVIDAKGKVLLPGFIDAHYHGESFLLRHIVGTTPMARWEKDRHYRTAYAYLNDEASREDLESLYRIAYFNALKAGITCLADFGLDNLNHHPMSCFEAMKRAELKGFIGLHNGDQLEKCRSLQSTNIRFGVTISNEDDLTTYTLQTALRSADELKFPLMVHLGETRRALETLKKNFHRTTSQLLNEYHLFNMKMQLSHASVLEGEDADVLAASKIPVIVSPTSAVLKEVEIPPVGEFLSRGIPIALGTDWGVPDPLTSIRTLVSIVRTQGRSIPGPLELLAMCTRNGAQALGFLDVLGTIEPGKKADITFVDVADTRLGLFVKNHHYLQILNSIFFEGSSRDISDVMINGNFYVREGTVLTYSEEDLLMEGDRLLSKLSPQPLQKELPSRIEEERRSAPVLSFETSQVIEDAEEPSEEGFRIMKKEAGSGGAERGITPANPATAKPVDVSKNVRKVFGEDDL